MRATNYRSHLSAALAVLLLVSSVCEVQARGVTRRIRFARGRTTAVLKNSLVRGDVDRYILGARAGQTMTVHITSLENNAVFNLQTPSGKSLEGAGEVDDATDWSGELPESGDYIIEVGGTRGNATYTLEVTIR
ncbi:MAG: hypothetical protein LC742_02685 [Acidobacteria bacterium]|nr:hypothetical protein [Acidobacteriota bacterium]